jgi:hypothetical protein
MSELPNISSLVLPIVALLKSHGPLGHKAIEKEIIEYLSIPASLSQLKRTGNRTELNYRLSWARTKAKTLGYIERETTGVWSITDLGKGL